MVTPPAGTEPHDAPPPAEPPRDGGPSWARWRARWPNADASRFVRAAGLTWHVQIAGDGPVVLLLHGSGGGTHSWERILPRLAARATVIACDLPGHAFTSAPPSERQSLPGMAADVAALLTTLGLRPAVAVGHSAAGPILLRMALDGALPDVQTIVGINAALVAPPETYASLVAPWLQGLFTAAPVVWLATRLAARDGTVEAMLRSTGSRVPPELVACYQGLAASERHVRATLTMMARWDLPSLLRDVPALRVPTLLLTGANDHWVPPDAMRRVAPRLPGAEFELWPGQGHLMHEEIGDAVAERVLRAASAAGVLPPV